MRCDARRRRREGARGERRARTGTRTVKTYVCARASVRVWSCVMINDDVLIARDEPIAGLRRFETLIEVRGYGSGRLIPPRRRRGRTTPRRDTFAGQTQRQIFNSHPGRNRRRSCFLNRRLVDVVEEVEVVEVAEAMRFRPRRLVDRRDLAGRRRRKNRNRAREARKRRARTRIRRARYTGSGRVPHRGRHRSVVTYASAAVPTSPRSSTRISPWRIKICR